MDLYCSGNIELAFLHIEEIREKYEVKMSKIQMTEIQQIMRRNSTFKRVCNSFILSPECALLAGLVRGDPGHGRPCHHHQQDLHPFLQNQQTVSAQLDVQGNVFLLRR